MSNMFYTYGDGSGWQGQVANYASLPAPTGSGDVYLVTSSSGFLWNQRKGLYQDTGTWNRLSNPTFQVLDTESKFVDDITGNELTYQLSPLTANRIATWPDKSGTVAMTDDIVTNAWDDVMHTGNIFTILDTENLSAIINQNDTTNNPDALIITNTGSGNDITAPNFSLNDGDIIFSDATTLSMITDSAFTKNFSINAINNGTGVANLEVAVDNQLHFYAQTGLDFTLDVDESNNRNMYFLSQNAGTGEASIYFDSENYITFEAEDDVIFRTDSTELVKIENTGDVNLLTGSLSLQNDKFIKLGNGDNFQMWHSGSQANIFSDVGDLVIDNDDATGDIILQLGSDTSNTRLIVENDSTDHLFVVEGDGKSSFFNDVGITGDFSVTGDEVEIIASNVRIAANVYIDGTVTSIDTENLNVSDSYIDLNAGYTSTTKKTLGISGNRSSTGTGDTVTAGDFTPGVAFASNPTVITDGSATFTQGMIIEISNSTNNNGIFEVEDHTGTTLTVRGVGTVGTVEDFTRNQFVEETDSAIIENINVAILRFNISGRAEEGTGSTTPITYTELIEGLWNRTGTNLSPVNAGDDISTTGDIYGAAGYFTDDLYLTNDDGVEIYFDSARTDSGPVGNLQFDSESTPIVQIVPYLTDYANKYGELRFETKGLGGSVSIVMDEDGNFIVPGDITGTTLFGDLNGTINTDTTGTTQSPGDSSTKMATTAYVDAAVSGEDYWHRTGTTLTPQITGDDIASTGNIYISNNKGIVVGHDSKINVAGYYGEFQVLGTGGADVTSVFGAFSNDQYGSEMYFLKSRSTTIGGSVIVNDNDHLGSFVWLADDGIDYTALAARFYVEVDDPTPSVSEVGAAYVWEQGDGGGVYRETMRLTAAGALSFPDNGIIALGADNDLQVWHTGSQTNILNSVGNLVIDNTDVTSGIILQLGTDSSATYFNIKNDSGTDLFTTLGNGHAGIGGPPSTRLDVYQHSNLIGFRLRGTTPAVEIADFYVGLDGRLVFDLTSGTDTSPFFDFKSKDSLFGLVIRDSSGGVTTSYSNFYMNDATTDYLNTTVNANNATTGFILDESHHVGIKGIPSTVLDIYQDSTSAGLRIRGTVPAEEIVDMYVGASGNFIVDLSAGLDTDSYFDFRGNDDLFGMVIRDSSNTNLFAYANLYMNDATTDYLNIVIDTDNGTTGWVIDANQNIGVGGLPNNHKVEIFDTQTADLMDALKLTNLSDAQGTATGMVLSTGAVGIEKGALFFENDGLGNGRGTMYLCNDGVNDTNPVSIGDYLISLTPLNEVVFNSSITQISIKEPTLAGALIDNTNLDGAIAVHVSDKFAYVVSDGSDSLSIISIQDPTNPVLTGVVIDNTNLNGANGVHVVGDYAYVACYSGSSLTIVNIQDKTDPIVVGIQTGISGAGDVYVSGQFAYVTEYDGDYVTVVDISDPTNPYYISYIGGDGLRAPLFVYVSGNYAYVTGYGDNSLHVYDIGDPTALIHSGKYVDATYMGGAWGLYVSGRYAYISGISTNSIVILDIADPASITRVGELIDATNLNIPASLFLSGNLLYVACNGGMGLTVIDVSDPTNPTYVTKYTDATNLNGAYSVELVGEYAYVVSDISKSLSVIDLNGAEFTSVFAGNIETNTLQVLEDIQIGGQLDVHTSANISGTANIHGSAAVGQAFKARTVSEKRLSFSTTTDTATLGRAGMYAHTGTGADHTLTLSTVDIEKGTPEHPLSILIKDEGGGASANPITVATEGSQTINGKSTYVIGTNYGEIRLYSNGTNLFTMDTPAKNDIEISFKDRINSQSVTYETKAYMYFAGTDRIGSPESIKVTALVDDAGSPGDVRVYDLNNTNIIAEITGITDTTPTINDLGTISNLSAGETIWEIQLRVPVGDKEDIEAYSLSVLF